MNKKNRLLTLIIPFILSASMCNATTLLQDDFADSTLKDKNLKNPYSYYKYNYQDLRRISIGLKVIADIKSEKDIKEGETIVFRACHDVYAHGRKVLKKDDLVYARVETIIRSGMNGIPASIIIGDFKFDNIDSAKVTDTVEIFGQDRSLWVFPLKWALTFLPPTGSLTNFIKGGHASLKERETIELYYYPNW